MQLHLVNGIHSNAQNCIQTYDKILKQRFNCGRMTCSKSRHSIWNWAKLEAVGILRETGLCSCTSNESATVLHNSRCDSTLCIGNKSINRYNCGGHATRLKRRMRPMHLI